ncbi:chain length determinant protein tyrosine kinase EpsG [Paludibacterium paludis]|uniref:Chain length determinant protein tyrosine kinase EpsG n=2 Tax=Paludibacterium paludis TaxID=1225769 RepID=A0A918P3U6_9NEIS|nr:chain length determinant protein tyrosine kinase EpsG [Paludibacterium paludis]GGY15668.1 hypothetical protein GCM10011289_18740 [Paludibacterium paludis]
MDKNRNSAIGQMLLNQGKLTPQQAEKVLLLQKEQDLRFGEAAIKLGFISETDLQRVLSSQFDYAFLSKDDRSLSENLLAAYQPHAEEVEALRSLRSQLMLRWMGDGNKAVAVASHNAGRANSWLAANLAVVFSQLGERTLLIDGNMRFPSQHEFFKLDNRQGLSDILAGRATLECANRIPNLLDLSVLTAGTPVPNPQELLTRASFAGLMDRAEVGFDVIILDTPPMELAADAQMIAARSRGVVLLADAGKSGVIALTRCRDQLATSGATVLGCVLNHLKGAE